MNSTETEELKQYILERMGSIDGNPGTMVTLTCEKTEVIWADEASGVEENGCGEIVAQFQWKENEALWNIAADLFIMHLDNRHGLGVDMGPLT